MNHNHKSAKARTGRIAGNSKWISGGSIAAGQWRFSFGKPVDELCCESGIKELIIVNLQCILTDSLSPKG